MHSLHREAELTAALEQVARWNCRKLKLGSFETDGKDLGGSGSNLHQSLLSDVSTESTEAAEGKSADERQKKLVWRTLRQPVVKCNLALMTVEWMVCSFNFYLLYFIVSSFENGF